MSVSLSRTRLQNYTNYPKLRQEKNKNIKNSKKYGGKRYNVGE